MSDPRNTKHDTTDEPADPWALSRNGYDADKIYTRASDANGQSSVMHVKLSPALYYELQALVQSRAIVELRTYADVVRDALIHRLHHYRTMIPEGDSGLFHAIDIEVRQAEIDKVGYDRDAWSRLISDLDARLNDLIAAGECDEARWLISQNEVVESMSAAYVGKLEDVLRRHGDTLDRVAPQLFDPASGPRIGGR